MAERTTSPEPPVVDPHASPWPVPAVEGIPFDDDSPEAHAIRRVLARDDHDRDAAAPTSER